MTFASVYNEMLGRRVAELQAMWDQENGDALIDAKQSMEDARENLDSAARDHDIDSGGSTDQLEEAMNDYVAAKNEVDRLEMARLRIGTQAAPYFLDEEKENAQTPL